MGDVGMGNVGMGNVRVHAGRVGDVWRRLYGGSGQEVLELHSISAPFVTDKFTETLQNRPGIRRWKRAAVLATM